MPFIWRHKLPFSSTPEMHPQALATLDAGYVLLDIATGKEEYAPHLKEMFNIEEPLSLDALGGIL